MAKASNKVIITCAVTGAIHTPTLSAGLPYTPADIARQAIDAAQAGAAILHLHARNPQDGSPTGDPGVFAQFLPQIHASTDAVINLTTGGSPGYDRRAAPRRIAAVSAGDVLAQHGLDELRLPRHGREDQRLEVSLGEAIHRGQRGLHLPQYLSRRRARLPPHGRLRHPLRARVLRHRSPLQSGAISSTRVWPSRRCGSRACSAFWAASAPIRTTSPSCAVPPTGCSARTTSGRCSRPAGTRCR